MDDEPADLSDEAILDVARRLEAYADANLSPSEAATTRMRTHVMNAARQRAAITDADVTFDAGGATTDVQALDGAKAARTGWHRPVAVVLAAGLALAILTGTAFAAQPGGPLYAVRVWTEMAILPADLVTRAEAEVDRLDQRISEAQQASSASDAPATEAALLAYTTIVVEADRGSGGDPTARTTIRVAVTRHVIVLTLMVATVPGPARGAVEQALSTTSVVLDDLEGTGATSGWSDERGRT
jgi:hypothetical protein